jgi:hypothetical protein
MSPQNEIDENTESMRVSASKRRESLIKTTWSRIVSGRKPSNTADLAESFTKTATHRSSRTNKDHSADHLQRNADGIPIYSSHGGFRYTGQALTKEQWNVFFDQEQELANARNYIEQTKLNAGIIRGIIDTEHLHNRVVARAEDIATWRRENFGEGEFVPEKESSIPMT